MRKMKKINGFLVVRFNDREKQGYPQIGSFGVIDAELYTGSIDVDLDALEYDDADTIEVAVEQARGLDAEQDYSDELPVYTVVVETPEEVREEEVEPALLVNGMEAKLQTQIKSKGFPYITPTAAAHELVGYKTALYDLGLLGEDGAVTDLHHFKELCEFQDDDGYHINVVPLSSEGMANLSPHDFEEGETYTGCTVQILRCRRCGRESFAWSKGTAPEQEEAPYYPGERGAGPYHAAALGMASPGKPKLRTGFDNLPENIGYSLQTKRIYALGLALAEECPDNDCKVYFNIFNMARSLDDAIDEMDDPNSYPAIVLRQDLHKQLRELGEMYFENYAIQKFREGMQS